MFGADDDANEVNTENIPCFICCLYMILQYFPVADEDELTFDPGEVINNIEFVSMIGLHTKLFNICRIPRTVVKHMYANIYTCAQILACDMIFCVSEFL